MQVVQSYYTSIMRANLSLYETRILLRIVERAQSALHGDPARAHIGQKVSADGVNYNFSIAIKELLSDGSHHYEDVREACSSLADKDVEWYSPDGKQWRKASMIYNVRTDAGSGSVEFSCAKWLIDVILDMTQGFSKYVLESAMSLRSPYAVRLYMLTASMSTPMFIRVEFLRDLLGVENMYSQTRDFIKRCVEPARAELERENVNGFTYEIIKVAGKIAKLRLLPVKREKLTRTELTAKAGLSAWCPASMRNYLMLAGGFSARELSANKNTLFQFSKLPAWEDRLQAIIERQRRGRFGKGYIIGALKSEIKSGGVR